MALLTQAYSKFRDDKKLTDTEKLAIAKLTDMFITCSLNPDTVHDTMGERLVNIVRAVNCHHHTRTCKKYMDKCHYGFPKFPLKNTLVVDKNEFTDLMEDEDNNKSRSIYYTKILSDVEELLNNEEKTNEIMKSYVKGKTEEEYALNRSKRIDDML